MDADPHSELTVPTVVPALESLLKAGGAPVARIETHGSVVFLAGAHAWKLKKRSLDANSQRAAAEEEWRLNQACAPSTYLAVLPYFASQDGRLQFEPCGEPVGWLLQMRRLSLEQSLDQRLLHASASAPELSRLAACIARFHASAQRVNMTPAVYRASLLAEMRRDRRVLMRARYGLPSAEVAQALQGLRRALRRLTPLLAARVADGMLVDGHGDLRAEHAYLGVPLQLIDRLDHPAWLRRVDPWDDTAFLALDCERLGQPRAARELLAAYARLRRDRAPRDLLDFHQARRALTRARLAVLHLDEARYRGQRKWRNLGLRWLALCHAHLRAGGWL